MCSCWDGEPLPPGTEIGRFAVEAVAIGGRGTTNDSNDGRDDGEEFGSGFCCSRSCGDEFKLSSSGRIAPPFPSPSDDDDEVF